MTRRWETWCWAALIVLAIALAYGNALSAPFIYDDVSSIPWNPTLRHWQTAFSPPVGGLTVSGRPLLNASFALNYAISGKNPWSYHALNLLIHAGAALALFGVLRRTFPHTRAYGRLAAAIALLWAVHPLQTESVTYLAQRAESMMGLFFLLTLYLFVRGRFVESVVACLLGMATKEVMVTAPVVVFLYDRAFIAGSWAEAWRVRRRYYLALASTWLLLLWLIAGTGGNRGGSVGFGVDVGWWAYELTQFPALVRYFYLTVWPHPLVLDYGTFWIRGGLAEVWPQALLVVASIAASLVLFFRNTAAGFIGAWYFGILAVSSLMPGTTQMIVEHRMYLSLAAALVFLALPLTRWLPRSAWCVVLAVAIPFSWATARRNQDYRSAVGIWSDIVAKRPDNASAHDNLGIALRAAGRLREAIAQSEWAMRLDPTDATIRNNLGDEYGDAGRWDDALAQFAMAARMRPADPRIQSNIGTLLYRRGRFAEAIPHFDTSARLGPDVADTRFKLAACLLQVGRPADAIDQCRQALQLSPDNAFVHFYLAEALRRVGDRGQAVCEYGEALKLMPSLTAARTALATIH